MKKKSTIIVIILAVIVIYIIISFSFAKKLQYIHHLTVNGAIHPKIANATASRFLIGAGEN